MDNCNFTEIEKKWFKKWKEDNLYNTDVNKIKSDTDKMYILSMFPYPSGFGLHAGHAYTFGCADVIARFYRLNRKKVFFPMGFDAFGIHGENYAIKTGKHPHDVMEKTCAYFRDEQMNRLGLSYDWNYEVRTYDPSYYKWTQWIFLQMYKNNLAIQKEAPVNYCNFCKTVLADEQIETADNKNICERCKNEVEKKITKQWFFKITEYADRLDEGLDILDWDEEIKIKQKQWIGKKNGANIDFIVDGTDKKITVFTTRIDTIFGVTFLTIAPEHEILNSITNDKNYKDVQDYIKQALNKSLIDRITEGCEKTGVFTGSFAINPFNGEKVPIYVSDFVLAHVGTGAVMGVPAHDQRDFEFAIKFNLPIKQVIKPKNDDIIVNLNGAFTEYGILFNSGIFDGLTSEEAKEKLTNYAIEKKFGKFSTTYNLKDWCISRQRYWGPPIPVIYCDKCGTVPVDEKDLPVLLPQLEIGWGPVGDGKGPLASVDNFINTKCPKCGIDAKRETDTMDNFLDSSWYFLRYPSKYIDNKPFDEDITKKILPVDIYIAGREHACLHMMYSRFVTMFLYDIKKILFENPFKKVISNGFVLGPDGRKMSKSLGNIVNPSEYVEEYGADATRIGFLFLGPFGENVIVSKNTFIGAKRFLNKVYNFKCANFSDENSKKSLHKCIKFVGEHILSFKFNTAIAILMESFNKFDKLNKEDFSMYLQVLSPFAPFITEEIWCNLFKNNYSIHNSNWPLYDNNFVCDDVINVAIQINGKLRGNINVNVDLDENTVFEKAKEDFNISKYITGKNIKRIIYVKNKLLSIVLD